MSKLIAAFAATLLCNVASAEEPHQTAASVTGASFASLDRNGDLRISKTEAGVNRALSNSFAYVDKDGDGFISQTEFAARQVKSRGP